MAYKQVPAAAVAYRFAQKCGSFRIRSYQILRNKKVSNGEARSALRADIFRRNFPFFAQANFLISRA